jgi:uncharacterized protein
MSAHHGRFVWTENMTLDPDRAVAFYSEVVGWDTEDMNLGGGAPPYTMWKTPGGRTVGGVMTLPDEARQMGAPPHWFGNIGTDDVDATVATAISLGATLQNGPMDIPTVGRVAILQDPQGAYFGAYQPETPMDVVLVGNTQTGDLGWSEMMCDDAAAAMAFYCAVFGWTTGEPMDMGPMGLYHFFHIGERPLGGMMNRPPDMPMSAWNFYFTVPDLDGAIEATKAGGGALIHGPMEVPGGDMVATLVDDQGCVFSLVMRAAG